MQLLVSVADGDEALAALAGGADIIDAKDPNAGALGAVSLEMFQHIHALMGGARPVSAALSDAIDELTIERLAREYSEAGAAFVKVGFAGIADAQRVRSLIAAAVAGAGPFAPAGVIAVMYADQPSIAGETFVRIAADAGGAGLLIDTVDKHGPGLRDLMSTTDLATCVDSAHEAGLVVAAAGKLTIDDLEWVRDCGADIAGVRGAACEHGRTSRVVAERVRLLRGAVSGRHEYQSI